MDLIAAYLTYQNLKLARNKVDVVVDAAPEDISDRAVLNYLLEVWKPNAFQSGNYELYQTLSGSEIPPRLEAGLNVMEGARFEISDYLDALVEWTPPVANQTAITVCPYVTTPYYLKSKIDPIADSEVTNAIEWSIKAKLNEDQFPAWRERFFSDWIGKGRRFLTWQEKKKTIDREQPEFLYFLINMKPKPAALKVRARLLFKDGTSEKRTLKTTDDVIQFCVYCIPVGFQALGLLAIEDELGKEIDSYEIWLNNDQDDRISEYRTYILNTEYNRNVRYLIYQNGLGGFDTIKCYGQASTSVSITANLAQKSLEAGYRPSSDELFVTSKFGERSITLNTGYLEADQLNYLEDLAWAEKVFLVTKEGFIPLVADSGTYTPGQDDENLAGRSFAFRQAKEALAYSNLPASEVEPDRITLWLPEQPYCVIDPSSGLRNGYQGAAKLRLYYEDTMQPVKSVGLKNNTPGTEGYYAPKLSDTCNPLTTPFKNTEIRRNGTFVRNNCTSSYGTTAEIVILAGAFGSDSSQVDADSRAAAEWERMNTQAYANKYGACVSGPEFYEMEGIESGKFHCRFGYISGVSAAISGGLGIISGTPEAVVYSNAWFATYSQNPNSIIYPVGSNDLRLPCNPGTVYKMYISINRKIISGSVRLQVYVNGAELFNQVYAADDNNITINQSMQILPDKAKMYIKFTPQ